MKLKDRPKRKKEINKRKQRERYHEGGGLIRDLTPGEGFGEGKKEGTYIHTWVGDCVGESCGGGNDIWKECCSVYHRARQCR